MISAAVRINYSKIRVKVSDASKKKVVEVAKHIVNYCIDNSPVDSGAFRQAWNVSEGSPVFLRVDKPAPGVVLPAPTVLVNVSSDFPTVYVTNGQPYAKALEEGHSMQAPVGVAWQAVMSARSLK